jgi:ABC-2 type transport system ATP-binding protein
VTALCKRIIVIDHGRLLFDGELDELSARLAPFKVIKIDATHPLDGYDFAPLGTVLLQQERKLVLRVAKADAATVAGRLLNDLPVLDLTIEDPPIEDVIARAFHGQTAATPTEEGEARP